MEPHKIFERRGQGSVLEIPITFDQAALGDDIIVPTLEGKVSYKVPLPERSRIRYSPEGVKDQERARKPQGRSLCKGKSGSSDEVEFQAEKSDFCDGGKGDGRNVIRRRAASWIH